MQINMLYYITNEIVDAAEENNPEVIKVLDSIAAAHRYGYHFVFSSRDILRRLTVIENYENKVTSQVYKTILEKYSIYGGIISKISLRVVFLLNDPSYFKRNENEGYSEIGYHISNVSVTNLINKTGLLGENSQEITFYLQMVKFYQKKIKTQIPTQYNLVHGGGDTTNNVLSLEDESKERFCLAILDSDRKYPDGPFGDTLRKIIAKRKKEVYHTTHYIYSDKYREVENMIPIQLLRTVCLNYPDSIKGVEDLENIKSNDGDVNFYDVKKGISHKKYSTINEGPEKKYVTNHIMLARNLSEKQLKNHIKPDSAEKLLFGTGDQSLNRVIEYFSEGHSEWVEETTFDADLEKEWIRMGEEILNWTCAAPVMRS